ncbi:MAG: autotransporter outer membrane beta-barrel domain-containing protein [Pseudomonadota bacterium]
MNTHHWKAQSIQKRRNAQKRLYGQTATLGERVDPGTEDGRPIIDLPGFLGDERFNLFGASNITFGDNDDAGQDSLSYAVSGGFSWLVLPRLNIGLAGRYQQADIDSAISEIDADTWGIAAFAQSQFAVGKQAINLEGIVAYSRSNLDSIFDNLGVITTSDSITQAFSSQVRTSTTFQIQKISFSPFLSLSYISTDQESFLLSDGQFAPGETNDQVTFSSGASLSTSLLLPDTEIQLSPSFGVGAFGTVTDGGNVGFSANGSLGFRSKRGIGGGLGVGFSGFTGGTRNVSLSGNISIPFN